jgi:hypothetical protein
MSSLTHHVGTNPGISRRKWRSIALLGLLAAAGIGATVGDVLYVNRVALPIRNGRFAFDKVNGTALQGETLTVTAVEGTWLKVKYTPKPDDPSKPLPAVEGYVLEDALSAREVAAAGSGASGGAVAAGAAGASRGLLDSAKYASAKGLNPEPFYRMVTDSREAMTDKKFEAFSKAGRVGPNKPAPVASAQ